MRSIFLHCLIASILASITGIVYQFSYQSALGCDFSKLVNPISISMASSIGCLLMSFGYLLLMKLNVSKLRGWLNIVISFLSIISIIGPMGASLPLDMENPELFPGLIAPLHLFPALSFLSISSLFKNDPQ